MKMSAGALFALLFGCGEVDECQSLPPSFQLDLTLADRSIGADVAFIAITLRINEQRWRQRFPVNGELDDGASSLAITVTPAPESLFPVLLDIAALDVATSTLATAQLMTTASDDGCNQFSAELR